MAPKTAPMKICDGCGNKSPTRSKRCKHCGHKFTPPIHDNNERGYLVDKKEVEKIGKGFTRCKNCETRVPITCTTCPMCGANRRYRPQSEIDWRDLSPGDQIEVFAGGPYYEHSDGSREYMGERGWALVLGVMNRGLHVVTHNGHSFLYMLNNEYTGVSGLRISPYAIRKYVPRRDYSDD